jgi:hypothetical protein
MKTRHKNTNITNNMSEIPLIPRPFKRMSAADRVKYAKAKSQEKETKDLHDQAYINKTKKAYEDHIRKERKRLGLS